MVVASTWLDFRLEPFLALQLVAVAAVYLAGVRRAARWPVARTASFLGGLLALAVAWQAGPAAHAKELLSAHMTQHMIIWLVACPLLAAGAPIRLAFKVADRRWRRLLAFWRLLASL